MARIVIRAAIAALAVASAPAATAERAPAARVARFQLDCEAPAAPISPDIYGIATWFANQSEHQWATGATARRWGGNATSRYNWALGNAWNLNRNWFFRNARISRRDGFSYDTFLEENRAHGVRSALTVPMLGWVARDTESYSFPVSILGPQQATARDLPDAGNGRTSSGQLIPPLPQARTSVPSTPDDIERWVRAIRERDRDQGRGRTVHQYILDNEPMLWHETHRDVHPEPVTYDELLEKTIAYAAAIRRGDPEAIIAGPAEWGWLAYRFSARDKVAGVRLRPDRLLHGDVPLIPWYLRKIREHERKTGTRVLDVLDVHFYPAHPQLGVGAEGATDAEAAALRIRSTRSLWDPTYVDESWIKERMEVLTLLGRWVRDNAPGLGISIGEWNFGAETHMSGGLAVAEVLGRFGTQGVQSAFYWTYPPDRSPAFWAFRAFRNFDGGGGRFLDLSVPVRTSASLASLFASRDAAGQRIVAVLLNHDPGSPLRAQLELRGCRATSSVRAFTYRGEADGFRAMEPVRAASTLEVTVEPYTITVLDLGSAASPGAR